MIFNKFKIVYKIQIKVTIINKTIIIILIIYLLKNKIFKIKIKSIILNYQMISYKNKNRSKFFQIKTNKRLKIHKKI